jgi:hypothetical protein
MEQSADLQTMKSFSRRRRHSKYPQKRTLFLMKSKPRERDLKTGGNVYEENQTKLKPKQKEKSKKTKNLALVVSNRFLRREGRKNKKSVCVCVSLSVSRNQHNNKEPNKTKT